MSSSDAPHTTSETLLRVLAVAGDAWTRSINAPFILEATNGSLRDDVFGRYLRVERGFVETSARVRAAAAFVAPSAEAMNTHRRAMNSLLDWQHPYLSQAITRLGIDTKDPGRDETLSSYFLRIARTGDYAKIVMAMLAAEELYATWCSVAADIDVPRNPLLAEWIELHVSSPFIEEVAQLTDELEALVPSESAIAELGRCAARVLDLEVVFHNCAYLPDE